MLLAMIFIYGSSLKIVKLAPIGFQPAYNRPRKNKPETKSSKSDESDESDESEESVLSDESDESDASIGRGGVGAPASSLLALT